MPDTGVAPNKTFVPSDGIRSGDNVHQQQQGAGTGVDPVLFDALMNEFATVINNCLRRNGDNKASANLHMGGFNFDNLSEAIANGQALRFEQMTALLNGDLPHTGPINAPEGITFDSGTTVFNIDNTPETAIFTPAMADAAGNLAGGYSGAYGDAIKINGMVNFVLALQITSKGAMNAFQSLNILNLPWTRSATGHGSYSACSTGYFSDLSLSKSSIGGYVTAGTNFIQLTATNAGGSTSLAAGNLSVSDISDTFYAMYHGTYPTDD